MNFETTYLGLRLKNPLVPSASPLSTETDTVKKLEDAGASAIVMYSLFEEQINMENQALDHFLNSPGDSFAEALSYFPQPDEYHNLHAEEYLEQIRELKETVDIPVIASLNGVSEGGWMKYATRMQEAGADALELNIYYIAADPGMTSEEVESMYVNDLKAVKEAVTIPVSVKLGPFFSAFANMAMKLEEAGADVAYHTDDGITDSRLFLRMAAYGVRAGMSREGALEALTIRGAEMMDLDDQIGSLVEGKDADFILLDGDPFSVYTHVQETWIDGVQVYDRSNPDHYPYSVGGDEVNQGHIHSHFD